MANEWTFEILYPGESVWVDIYDKVDVSSIKKNEVLFTDDMRPKQSTVKFSIQRDTTLINNFLIAEGNIQLRINDYNDDPFFRGYIRNNWKLSVEFLPAQLVIEAEDYGKNLKKKVDTTFKYAGYKICDPLDTSNSIIHQMMVKAGFTTSDVGTGTTISQTITNFVVVENEKSYWEIMRELLYNFGYSFYFDASGVLQIFQFIRDTITTTLALNNTNMGQPLVYNKKPEKYEAVEVEWYPHIVETNLICFSDTTGGDKTTKAHIPITAGDFYPIDADQNTTYCEYKVDDYEVVLVETPTLDAEYDSGILIDTPLTNYYRMAEVVFENPTGGTLYINKFDIVGGTVTLKGDKHRTRRENVLNTEELLTIQAEYIHTESLAQRLAVGLADIYYYNDFVYNIPSSTDIALGTYCSFSETLTGASTDVLITNKETTVINSTYLKYKYTAQGVSEYTSKAITTQQRKKSSDNSRLGNNTWDSNEDKPTYEEVTDEGWDEGDGTTTPSVPTLTATDGYRRILLEVNEQGTLTNFSHYEYQVSDDEVSWYSLKTNGTDWKALADPEYTTIYNEWFMHENIPLSGTVGDPSGTGLYYRVRRVTKTGTKSAWSTSAYGEALPYHGEDILAGTIAAEKIVAGSITADRFDSGAVSVAVNNINSSCTIEADTGFTSWSGDPDSPANGDTRAIQDDDELKIQRYNGTSWVDEGVMSYDITNGGYVEVDTLILSGATITIVGI